MALAFVPPRSPGSHFACSARTASHACTAFSLQPCLFLERFETGPEWMDCFSAALAWDCSAGMSKQLSETSSESRRATARPGVTGRGFVRPSIHLSFCATADDRWPSGSTPTNVRLSPTATLSGHTSTVDRTERCRKHCQLSACIATALL